MISVILDIKDFLNNKKKLLHYTIKKIAVLDESSPKKRFKEVDTDHPPPVDVKGPLVPGDKRGFTYLVESMEEAEAFVEHMKKSGLVKEYWIEEE